ncbi:MAG: rhomboid family intramembrane serine protease [Puniceicoccales bacterium]|jgi:membrane associated rhomboid family serine protease|nr:rhomboid family intramembrane serine protease [Puniceicoccales bacterium]
MEKAFRVGDRNSGNALKILLGTMVSVFLLDKISSTWFGNNFFNGNLSLSVGGLGKGNLWQLVTYMFIHEGLGHILCNAIVLFFVGKLVEQRYGGKRLVEVFLFSGLLGAGAWFLVHGQQFQASLVGASAGCLGIFSYFCFTCENRPSTFLLFFTVPLRLKPRMLLAIAAGLEVYGLLFQELRNGAVANSAHLGGILGGCGAYFFFRYWRKYVNTAKGKLTYRARTSQAMHGDSYKLYITSYSAKRSEVDRILDKINESGFGSLSEAEKRTLNGAKQLVHR